MYQCSALVAVLPNVYPLPFFVVRVCRAPLVCVVDGCRAIALNTAPAAGTGRVGDDTRRANQAHGHAGAGREFSGMGKTMRPIIFDGN